MTTHPCRWLNRPTLVLTLGLLLVGAGAAARAEPARTTSSLEAMGLAPHDAGSGYVIVGPVTKTTWAPGGATISVAGVDNNSVGNSQALFLNLWATPVSDGVPTISPSLNFQQLAGVGIGTLRAGKSLGALTHSGLSFLEPPPGCYYVSLALLNGVNLVDLFPFSFHQGGVPDATGYAQFAFGAGVTCNQTVPCIGSSVAACLNGNRFQVTATYYNAIDGKAPASVQAFGATRAESDETVFYTFTDPGNFELGVKVLSACGVNNSWWVFTGGLTNEGWEVNVLDTVTGRFKTYTNDLNTISVTDPDTAAFPCP